MGRGKGRGIYSPHRQMSTVANLKLVAKGAKNMAAANVAWPHIHTVRRSGLYLLNFSTTCLMLCGGRWVKLSSSGDLTTNGNTHAPINVMIE